MALFPALGGYAFLLLCNATRPRVRHASGYHLVFASALAGVVFYIVSFLMVACFDLGSVPVVKAALGHATMDMRYGTAVSAAVLSVTLPPVAAWMTNRWASRESSDRRAAERAGRLREVLLHEAMSERGLVEVSLESGKCYVAFVQKVVIAQPQYADVLLVPLLSGYRHPETRELHITTNYSSVLERQPEAGMNGDLPIGISLSGIVSVRPFDLAIWDEFTRPSPMDLNATGDGGAPEP